MASQTLAVLSWLRKARVLQRANEGQCLPPSAWVCPVPEPVGLKVWAKRRKSSFFSPEEDEWKRGSTAQNPRGLSQGSIQFEPPTEDEGVILYHQSQPLEEWIQQNIH